MKNNDTVYHKLKVGKQVELDVDCYINSSSMIGDAYATNNYEVGPDFSLARIYHFSDETDMLLVMMKFEL